MLSVNQTPKDGVGQEKTLYGHAVRLRAKNLTTTRTTTVKVTGMTSGAVFYIDVVVQPKSTGEKAVFGKPISAPIGLISNKKGRRKTPASQKSKGIVKGGTLSGTTTLKSSK